MTQIDHDRPKDCKSLCWILVFKVQDLGWPDHSRVMGQSPGRVEIRGSWGWGGSSRRRISGNDSNIAAFLNVRHTALNCVEVRSIAPYVSYSLHSLIKRGYTGD